MRKIVIMEDKAGVVSIVPENCRNAVDVVGLLRYALLIEERQCVDAYARERRSREPRMYKKNGAVAVHFGEEVEACDGEATSNR